VVAVEGSIEFADGRREPVTTDTLSRAPEAALQAMTVAVVALAVSLLVLRLS
jgi:hypothetical protein